VAAEGRCSTDLVDAGMLELCYVPQYHTCASICSTACSSNTAPTSSSATAAAIPTSSNQQLHQQHNSPCIKCSVRSQQLCKKSHSCVSCVSEQLLAAAGLVGSCWHRLSINCHIHTHRLHVNELHRSSIGMIHWWLPAFKLQIAPGQSINVHAYCSASGGS